MRCTQSASQKNTHHAVYAVCKAKEKAEPKRNLRFRFSLVPAAGVEPAPCRQDRILSPARLPIPSRRQTAISIIQNSSRKVNNF